jgi:hypothetical protein
MRLGRLIVPLAVLALLVVPMTAGAKQKFEAYGSCATAKPFTHAGHCAFDGPEHARGTIVFRSHAGKQKLKVCQKITGLDFKGQQCVKGKNATAYEAIPFELNGAYGPFKVVITIYVKKPGAHAPYKRAAHASLRFG